MAMVAGPEHHAWIKDFTAGVMDPEKLTAAAQAPPRAQPGVSASDRSAGAPPDTGRLVAKLTPKVRQMLEIVGKDPTRKAELHKLATDAQDTLRHAMLSLAPGDVQQAAASIDLFCKAVDAAAGPSGRRGGGFGTAGMLSDIQGLSAVVGELAKRGGLLTHANPALRDVIQKHVKQVDAALKKGDIEKATEHKDLLSTAIDTAADAAASEPKAAAGDDPAAPKQGAPSSGNDAALAKHKTALRNFGAEWLAAESKMRRDVDALGKAVNEHFGESQAAAQAEAEFQSHVDKLFSAFDGELQERLSAAAAAKDDADLAAISADLRKIASRYADQLSKDPVIALFDDNPFIHMDIDATFSTALQRLTHSWSPDA